MGGWGWWERKDQETADRRVGESKTEVRLSQEDLTRGGKRNQTERCIILCRHTVKYYKVIFTPNPQCSKIICCWGGESALKHSA